MRQIFLDTETTGLSAENGDRIIEIGCVELVARKLTGNNKHFYLNPERDSHEDAMKVHGISNEFLKDKPKFAVIVEELLDYLRGAEIIIHNAPFDVSFLNKELELIGQPPIRHCVAKVTDSLMMAKELFPGKRNSLDALCDRLEVDNSGRTLHGALLDAELLADVYINLTRGQNSLMMDTGSTTQSGSAVPLIDLSQFQLPLLLANDQEMADHEKLLADIDNASKGKTVWRTAVAAT
ncbi:MAG: DNA polymerase III subunit epsilon [Polaromonas sp.]|nr:DNA polymerase III subunit epsilon [Polaromonas sp.]